MFLLTENLRDAPKPNVIFLLADDLGYGDVGYNALNGSHTRTPHLDKMAGAEHSIQFSRFYSGSPVCSIHTGQFSPVWEKNCQPAC